MEAILTEDAWLKLLSNSPLAAVVAAGGFGLWRFAKWLASKVVEPMIESLKSYMASQDESMKRIADSSEKHAEILDALQSSNNQKVELLGRMETTEMSIKQQVDAVHTDVLGIKTILEQKGH